jgi:hypothetical protein
MVIRSVDGVERLMLDSPRQLALVAHLDLASCQSCEDQAKKSRQSLVLSRITVTSALGSSHLALL